MFLNLFGVRIVYKHIVFKYLQTRTNIWIWGSNPPLKNLGLKKLNIYLKLDQNFIKLKLKWVYVIGTYNMINVRLLLLLQVLLMNYNTH